MRYAIIEDNKVINIALAEPDFAQEQGWIEATSETEIGGLYENGQFLPKPRNIEAEWNQIRVRRDKLLSESDVYVLSDRWELMTSEQQTVWSAYRQELRDIPQTYEDPAEVIWPIKPE